MEFTVKFRTGHDKLRLFDNIQTPDGRTLHEIAEEESGLKLKSSLIHKDCNIDMKRTATAFNVHGQYAKAILDHPVFKHHTVIEVVVPEGWFGQFIYDRVYVERRDYDNHNPFWWACEMIYDGITRKKRPIRRVSVTSTYKQTDVLDAWFHAGMPDYWGISEERNTEMVMREIACKEARKEKNITAERAFRKKEKEEAEAKRLENESKKTVALTYFAEQLELMTKEVHRLQQLYNG